METCMKISKVGICANFDDESEQVRRHHCMRRTCQACWPAWASRLSIRAAERIEAYTRLSKIKERLRHFVFSPPQAASIELLGTPGGYEKLRTRCYDMLRRTGMTAGTVVFHPYRVSADGKEMFRIAKKIDAGVAKHGIWSFLKRYGLVNSPCVYASPHFHIIGYGFLVRSDNFFASTGWVYKSIRTVVGRFDCKRVLFYQLSHAGVFGNAQSITYFGGISYRRMHCRVVKRTREPVLCPVCGGAVNECSGWRQDVFFDEDLGYLSWDLTWLDNDIHDPRVCDPNFPLTYSVVKRVYWMSTSKGEYWMVGHSDEYVELSRGENPMRACVPHVSLALNPHREHAFDWSHRVWIDDEGCEVGDTPPSGYGGTLIR